jgi:hypothetical protein
MLELRRSSDRKAYVAGSLDELPKDCAERQPAQVIAHRNGKPVEVTVLGGYYFPAGKGSYGAWVQES